MTIILGEVQGAMIERADRKAETRRRVVAAPAAPHSAHGPGAVAGGAGLPVG